VAVVGYNLGLVSFCSCFVFLLYTGRSLLHVERGLIETRKKAAVYRERGVPYAERGYQIQGKPIIQRTLSPRDEFTIYKNKETIYKRIYYTQEKLIIYRDSARDKKKSEKEPSARSKERNELIFGVMNIHCGS
jgi:hypothetical protein